MVDAKILESEWVVPNEEGDGWGYKLKEGAPDDVVKEFEEFEKLCELYG